MDEPIARIVVRVFATVYDVSDFPILRSTKGVMSRALVEFE